MSQSDRTISRQARTCADRATYACDPRIVALLLDCRVDRLDDGVPPGPAIFGRCLPIWRKAERGKSMPNRSWRFFDPSVGLRWITGAVDPAQRFLAVRLKPVAPMRHQPNFHGQFSGETLDVLSAVAIGSMTLNAWVKRRRAFPGSRVLPVEPCVLFLCLGAGGRPGLVPCRTRGRTIGVLAAVPSR